MVRFSFLKSNIYFLYFSIFQLRYDSPRILNDMTKYAIDHHEDMNFQDFNNFVHILSFIGYQPECFDVFQDVCIKMLDKHIKQAPLQRQLRFTLDLCKMQIFPDHWLSSIFTLNYIEVIDDHIAGKSTNFLLTSWGCRIHWLLLCRGIRTTPSNECPGYDIKQSDGEVPVMLKLWGMWSTPSLLSLPGPLWSRVAAPDWVLSMGQIELNCVLIWNKTVFTLCIAQSAELFEIELFICIKTGFDKK